MCGWTKAVIHMICVLFEQVSRTETVMNSGDLRQRDSKAMHVTVRLVIGFHWDSPSSWFGPSGWELSTSRDILWYGSTKVVGANVVRSARLASNAPVMNRSKKQRGFYFLVMNYFITSFSLHRGRLEMMSDPKKISSYIALPWRQQLHVRDCGFVEWSYVVINTALQCLLY